MVRRISAGSSRSCGTASARSRLQWVGFATRCSPSAAEPPSTASNRARSVRSVRTAVMICCACAGPAAVSIRASVVTVSSGRAVRLTEPSTVAVSGSVGSDSPAMPRSSAMRGLSDNP